MSTPPIEAPEHEVVRITGTIEFTGGGVAGFTVGHDENIGSGEQPWIGKSTDIREAIIDAIAELGFWDDGRVYCPNCGELVDAGEMNYTGPPYEMCDSCVHNAKRSGWMEPSDVRGDIQREAIRVYAKYRAEPDPTPEETVDEMAAVLKKVAEATE
jgi:hypothetical protein